MKFYGITKDPETKEFIMIVEIADMGSLRSVLSTNFNKLSWGEKIHDLHKLSLDLKILHDLGFYHRDFHSGNILQKTNMYSYSICLSDFGLSRPAYEQKSDDKVYGVLPYIAPEVLDGKQYTKASDIYSFGVLMTEFSSGKLPFYNRKHDFTLALDICNGVRPEFGKGTPEFFKKLAYRCMNANPDQRPTADELKDVLCFWVDVSFGQYYEKEIKEALEEADKEIPNISTSYQKDSDAVYTSRAFTFSNLPNPVNSSLITSYLEKGENKN